MSIDNLSPEAETEQADADGIEVSEQEVVSSALIQRGSNTSKFYRRSRVQPSPPHPEILYTD